MKKPMVTILMPVYNGQKYLKEVMKSIVNQTFRNFEFLIINDGSIDKTEKILEQYKEKDVRIKVLNRKQNIGLTKSLNEGLKIARGEYIARIDVDDISEPGRFEKQVKYLDKHPEVSFIGTWSYIIDENGKIVGKERVPIEDREIRKKLIESNQFFSSSVMFRKECAKKVGFYREEFIRSQDYDIALRISEKYKVANIPEFLCRRRIHPFSITVQKRNEQCKFAELAKTLAIERKLYGKDSLAKSERRKEIVEYINSFTGGENITKGKARKRMAKIYEGYGLGKLVQGDVRSARRSFLKSIKNNPYNIKIYLYIILTLIPASIVRLLRFLKIKFIK